MRCMNSRYDIKKATFYFAMSALGRYVEVNITSVLECDMKSRM